MEGGRESLTDWETEGRHKYIHHIGASDLRLADSTHVSMYTNINMYMYHILYRYGVNKSKKCLFRAYTARC